MTELARQLEYQLAEANRRLAGCEKILKRVKDYMQSDEYSVSAKCSLMLDIDAAIAQELTAKPIRVQLSRKKGWRMPPNTVNVSRPGRWGNPYRLGPDGNAAQCVAMYRLLLAGNRWTFPTREDLKLLRGKNLACWCQPGQPCHADVLLELVNK